MAATRQIFARLGPLNSIAVRRSSAHFRYLAPFSRALQSSAPNPAVVLPITAHGEPPHAPLPARSQITEFRARQKAESSRNKRFWKEVHVVETDGSFLFPSPGTTANRAPSAGFTINLDKRAIKTPKRAVIVILKTKPLLAQAIALEWSHLRSAADAQQSHRIPLTQMSSRAIDMATAEAEGDYTSRNDAVNNLIRYLDTDTVLCWAPTTPKHLREPGRPQLRDLQISSAKKIMDYLSTRVWPGLEIRPVDGDVGIIGKGQPAETRETLLKWMREMDTWKLIGFERIVHSTKSFVIGARMLAEWGPSGEGKWGVKEAAEAADIEVNYQTKQWGEVEDTHDVQKEDLGRQLGAGWLIVCGAV